VKRTLLSTTRDFIRDRHLLYPEEKILAAVSGGADSICMLDILHRLRKSTGSSVVVAHLNHRLRGSESAADADFVREQAEQRGLPFVSASSNVRATARRAGISLEMAARDARYRFFAREAKKHTCDVVATAHTMNDQAETMLLRLTRGAGSDGLAGILPQTTINGVRVVRPLLFAQRNAIESYLRTRRLHWREDSSNRDEAFLRNRVRAVVLPLLADTLNPAVVPALSRAAEILRAEDALLAEQARDVLAACLAAEDGWGLNVEEFARYPLALRRRVVLLWLNAHAVAADFQLVERVLRLAAQRDGSQQINPGCGVLIERRYHILECVPETQPEPLPDRIRIPVPGTIVMPGSGIHCEATIEPGIHRKRSRVGRLPACASLSRSMVGRKQLYLRLRRDGDRIQPMGMKGTRKIQDILVDAKVPRRDRENIPVVECGGTVVWLPGYSVARGWGVEDASADTIQLRLELFS
jgi:tRNA(Ile)-lysidine synthase